MAHTDELGASLLRYAWGAQAVKCPGAHKLLKGRAEGQGLVCDLCSGALSADDTTVRSCRPCDFDVCEACFLDPGRQQSTMSKRLRSYADRCSLYDDPVRQARALEAIPPRLQETSGRPIRGKEHLLELLRWFKGGFFRWTDKPPCNNCGGIDMKQDGMAEPMEEELRYGATRIEAWRCVACSGVSRFPRYNDPARLLETRHGRCGEWANCFTLCLAALGYEHRLVVDWTDHVWSEVWLGDWWLHCDPCETLLDAPLTYENGWGKKLTYIIAFSSSEVVDVAPRYTARWEQVLRRRTAMSEERFRELVAEVDQSRRQALALCVPSWRLAEQHELASRRCATGGGDELTSIAELQGRTSGSAEWRIERGELGTSVPLVVQESPYALLLDPGSNGADHSGITGASTIARLSGDATFDTLEKVPCVNICGESSAVEIVNANGKEVKDAFLSSEGFTVEAWVHIDDCMLHEDSFRNPLLSRHGPASGWELRLLRGGGAVFLVTLEGVHYEVKGVASDGTKAWCRGWTHVAGSLDNTAAYVFISGHRTGTQPLPKANVGARSTFAGPLLLGRNPAWRDRGINCHLATARITAAALSPEAFMPLPAAVAV